MGWSVLPDSMIDGTIRRLAIPQLELHRELGAVWHERRTLSGAATALLRCL
ncbi:MAG: LysR substrate-binding domain-containing protein [Solimonas sp.]